MNEFKTEKAVYTPDDFQLWQRDKALVISPKFQRRKVWPTASKSFFIDTLLRGMTVPSIYLRVTKGDDGAKAVREVVDGQQRISSVLSFIEGALRLSKSLEAPWAGKTFAQLSQSQQDQIKSFTFSCEVFRGISDSQVLEVFCRLNMNGVPLNAQELRNGRFFGPFKQVSYQLAREHLALWRVWGVFTELNIARMLEVELTSELLISMNAGMQDKKKIINNFYREWEDVYPTQETDIKWFNDTIGELKTTFLNDGLEQSEFRRPPMFYTLFCVVFHRLFGLPGVQRLSPRKKFTMADRDGLRDAVARLSDVICSSKDAAKSTPRKYSQFILSSSRQTDNLNPRKARFNTLYGEAFD